MNLNKISDRLQNPSSTEDQMVAAQELKLLIVRAVELYDKYKNLGRDWTKETVSGTSSDGE